MQPVRFLLFDTNRRNNVGFLLLFANCQQCYMIKNVFGCLFIAGVTGAKSPKNLGQKDERCIAVVFKVFGNKI